MIIKRAADLRWSAVTDERIYLRRREFMRLAGGLAAAAAASPALLGAAMLDGDAPQSPLTGYKPKAVTTDEKLNTFEDITSYNNFSEFGTGKGDPQRYAGRLKTSPWHVKIDGL
jgi:sulfoxide reductase catalytic subunit YedY